MTAPPPSGLPAERTALAWSRTALSMTAVGLLLGRLSMTDHRIPTAAAGVVLLVTAAVTQVRTGGRPRPTAGRPLDTVRWLNLLQAAAVTAAATLVMVSVLIR